MSSDPVEVEGVLIISTDVNPAAHFIRTILGVEELPSAQIFSNNIKGYPWQFETKYFSAKVNLYAMEEKTAIDSSLSDLVKAIVFCFDSEKLSTFKDIVSWLPVLQNIDTEVQLLVCNNCSNESVISASEKKDILNWCVENHFELIELSPLEDSDGEDDSILPDVKGFARIIEALQSHTWANLVMKNSLKEGTDPLQEDKGDTETGIKVSCSGNSSNASENSKKVCVENEELLLEEKWLDNVLNGEDPGGESFEALFEKFASMKEKASALAGEDRKKYAEKVAIAFWRAMGGDEDEIEGLDED